MGFSVLNGDLAKLNIIADAGCNCGFRNETSYHYFFECPLYNTERFELFSKLNSINFEIKLESILFGDSKLSVENNVLANSFIQNYMYSSKRFTNLFIYTIIEYVISMATVNSIKQRN